MKEEATSRKVIRNTLFNYLAAVSVIAIRIVALPVIIHGLGNERYGIYVILMSVTGYVGLLDLGIGISLTKFVAEYYATRDYRRLNEMLSTSLVLYVGLGILGALVLVGCADLLIRHVFHIPPLLWHEARLVFWISAVSLFNGLTLGIFGNLLNGIQRQDVSRLITIASSLVTNGGGILLVSCGYKLVAFVLFSTATAFVSFLVQMAVARRLVPEVHLSPRLFQRREMKQIVNFSLAMFINQVAVRNMGNIDKLILGIFLPVGNVTLYAVGLTLTLVCFRIPAAAVLASMPAASELMARNQAEAVQELVLRGMKYTGLLAVAITTVVAVLSPDIIRLYMGEGFEQSARVLQLLWAGYFWLVLCASGMSVMVGIGRPYINTIYAVAQILLCSGLMVVMLHFFGLLGAAAGSGAAYTLGGLAYLVHSTIIFKIPFRRMIGLHVLGKILLLLLPAVPLALAHHLFPISLSNRAEGALQLLGMLGAYGLLYGFLAIRYIMDDYEFTRICGVLPILRHAAFLRRR